VDKTAMNVFFSFFFQFIEHTCKTKSDDFISSNARERKININHDLLACIAQVYVTQP